MILELLLTTYTIPSCIPFVILMDWSEKEFTFKTVAFIFIKVAGTLPSICYYLSTQDTGLKSIVLSLGYLASSETEM